MTERFWKTAALLLTCGAPVVIGGQAFYWLVTGEWIHLTLMSVWNWLELPAPSVKWVGLQEIIIWLLGFPLSGTIFMVGMIWGYLLVQAEK